MNCITKTKTKLERIFLKLTKTKTTMFIKTKISLANGAHLTLVDTSKLNL